MIIKKIDKDNFKVIIDSNKFKVNLDDDYWQKLTKGKISKEKLIEASFKFLLEREPISAILSEFNLKLIQKYFPEFEEKV